MARLNQGQRGAARLAAELARLGSLAPAELRSEWQAQEESTAPNVAAPLLRRLLAQRLQERLLGGLPALVVRELERTAREGPAPVSLPTTVALTPGTRLVREWQGRTIAVLATEDGFLWEKRIYRSLSRIASEVTGAHWSSPRFFGLTRRG